MELNFFYLANENKDKSKSFLFYFLIINKSNCSNAVGLRCVDVFRINYFVIFIG